MVECFPNGSSGWSGNLPDLVVEEILRGRETQYRTSWSFEPVADHMYVGQTSCIKDNAIMDTAHVYGSMDWDTARGRMGHMGTHPS
jgi:hypothetical protein